MDYWMRLPTIRHDIASLIVGSWPPRRSTLMVSPDRGGRYVLQPEGYRAFIPAMLPVAPPILLDDATQHLLSQADLALGRLDGAIRTLPSANQFTLMYVRKEAVLSSRIEGTRSTLDDVLREEAGVPGRRPDDVAEVRNYVAALDHGLALLDRLPLSVRLIKEVHRVLLATFGAPRRAGRYRRLRTGSASPARRSHKPPLFRRHA